MNTANHISPDDLSLIALQLLSEEEMIEALTHLEHCEACRNELAALQGDLALYAMTSEMHSPPAMARDRLMKRVSKEKKVVSMPTPVEKPVERERTLPLDTLLPPPPVTFTTEEPVLASRGHSMFSSYDAPEEPVRKSSKVVAIAAWTGWAVAAGVAVVAGLQFHQRQVMQGSLNAAIAKVTAADTATSKAEQVMHTLTNAGSVQIMMHIQPPAGVPALDPPEGRTAYDQASGALVFVASNMRPTPNGQTYELWVLPSDGSAAPIAAGIFRPDEKGNATVVMPEIPKGVAAKGFGVTLENAGGAKTPTMPPVLIGTVENGI